MKPLIVPLFSNPENNGLHSVYSLHFLLSTNLYIKDQQDMGILIKNIYIYKKFSWETEDQSYKT